MIWMVIVMTIIMDRYDEYDTNDNWYNDDVEYELYEEYDDDFKYDDE